MMIDTIKNHGANSFAGRLSSILQGSSDTTFYVIARWLAGPEPEALGIRVPSLPPETRRVLEAVGAWWPPGPTSLEAPTLERSTTSLRGSVRRAPRSTPGRCRTPSTVIDFTGAEPRTLREGAASSAEAIARVRRARVRSG